MLELAYTKHMTLISQVQTIYQLIDDDRIEKLDLFGVKGGALKTPVADDTLALMTHRSKRQDKQVDEPALNQLLAEIKATKKLKGLNHIGFCYKVASKQAELKRIVGEASKKGLHVYQEPSIDEADWLFVGDISEITNPMLEFLPIQGEPNDQWVDYWLPHIQFDIDTSLTPNEIKTLVQKYMPQPGSPYSIQIDGITYIQRVNLGCSEGVNLFLDISTRYRDVNYRKTWKELV